MAEAVDRSQNLAEGIDYLTVLTPGKTGLKFDRGKPMRVDAYGKPWFTIVIKSSLVKDGQLHVAWGCTDIYTPNVGGIPIIGIPDIHVGDKKVAQHFESKNINELFSIIRTEVLTEGHVPSEFSFPNIPNPLKPVGDLLDKAGTALIVAAVALAAFAVFKLFNKDS